MHAFYSKEQELSNRYSKNKPNPRYFVYLKDGDEIVVTEVSKNSDRIKRHAENFTDSEYLGCVTTWIKTVYWD